MRYVLEPLFAPHINDEGEMCGDSEELVGYALYDDDVGKVVAVAETREELLPKLYGFNPPPLGLSEKQRLYVSR